VRSRLSVGAKWALRYAVVTFVSTSLLGIYVYDRVEGRIRRDAELIVEIPVRNVIEAEKRHPDERDRIAEAIDREVSASDGDLRLGIQYFDPSGNLLIARGRLVEDPLPLYARVADGRVRHDIWQADLGDGSNYYVMTASTRGGFVQAVIYSRRFARHADFIADGFLLALPIALIVTVGLGWLLARGSLRPIQRITATARRISGSRLDEELPTTGSGDELDQLAVTLNEMMGRIRESVTRIRRFSGDAAHELRTPLAAIRNQVEVTLEKDRAGEEYERALRHVLEEVDRLARGTDAMLRLAHSEAGLDPEQRCDVDLAALLGDVVEFFEPLASEADVKLELHVEQAPTLSGDPAWLHQLFANLVHNALKFTPGGGLVRVEVGNDASGLGASVAVRDTGVGIDPDECLRIFERFHKVDAARSGGGFGLGLSLVREIAHAHGGTVSVESQPGRGSTFRVDLPGRSPGASG
jgi:heavy metal sensor kinase